MYGKEPMGEQTLYGQACVQGLCSKGTGCDIIGALAEIWRTGFLPFNPYNPLSISVCPYNTYAHCPSRKVTSLLLSKWFLSNLSPPWCLSLTPTHLLSKWTCTAHRILHLPFPWSVALSCLYLTVTHPSALELNFICTGNISMIIHQPCLWCWVTCHS